MRRRDFLRGTQVVLASEFLRPKAWAASATRGRRETPGRFGAATIAGIEQRLPVVMREKAVPGVSLAIVSEGRLVWQRAFGVMDAAARTPVRDDTVFEAASVSKTVFAYVALKLCERRVLGLDTPLTSYSKTPFVRGDHRIERVTPRQALSHCTGLPEWRSGASLQFESDPGTTFRYSGEGYYYLQSVLSQVAGKTLPSPCGRYEADLEVCATDFDAFMRRSLLDPLGLRSSGYEWRDSFERTAARPHDREGQPLPVKKPNAADVARYGAVGGLFTTASDYATILLAVLNQPSGAAYLSPAMRDEMIRPQVRLDPAEKIDGADSWALGWAVQQRPTGNVILHSGGQTGFRALTMASVERKSGFVIFTNSDSGGHVCHDPGLTELLNPLLAA